jgi:hypothetical protein
MPQFYNVCCHRYVNYNTRYGERRAYRRVPCGGEKSLKIVSMFVSLPLPHISRSLSSSCWVLSLHICTTTPCQQPGTSPSGRWIGGFCYGPALWSSCGSRIGMMRRTIAAQLEWHLTLEFHDTHIKTRDFTCKDNNSSWNRTTTSSRFSTAFSLSDLRSIAVAPEQHGWASWRGVWRSVNGKWVKRLAG